MKTWEAARTPRAVEPSLPIFPSVTSIRALRASRICTGHNRISSERQSLHRHAERVRPARVTVGENAYVGMSSPQQSSVDGGGESGGALAGSGGPGSSAYKRASRKGAPRRFVCSHPGCDKLYTRAEHLQRHQLNRELLSSLRDETVG